MNTTGHDLGLSENTVRTYAKNVFARLGVVCRSEAVALAYDSGLLRTRSGRAALLGVAS